jgi:hypothetical protein
MAEVENNRVMHGVYTESIRTKGIKKEFHEGYPFIDKTFVSCKELFPYWESSEKVLTDLCDNAMGLSINMDESIVSFQLSLGISSLDLAGIPGQYLFKVQRIIKSVIEDYTPDLSELINRENRFNQNRIVCIRNAVTYRE